MPSTTLHWLPPSACAPNTQTRQYGLYVLVIAPYTAWGAPHRGASMIPGVVNGNLEATVRFVVRGSGGQAQAIEAVIDTGFNSFLTLSPALVRQLGLPHIGQSRALLANGKEEILDLYEVILLWDGQWQTVETDAADTAALVGMSLLYRYSVYVEAVEGGQVVIAALP
jgi:predicted aspartyl protease